jgi:hypothetical protein
LFAVAVLTVILAASLVSPVAASGRIEIVKVTTNGDTTTEFPFEVSGDVHDSFELASGDEPYLIYPGDVETAKVAVIELVPDGWVLTNVNCEGLPVVDREPSTFEYIAGGVVIVFVAPDDVVCTFTNSPEEAVGGVVIPVNTLVVLAPWLVVIGLVGCIGTVAVLAKKRSL